ncbi:MAG: glutaredoxin domain-containing protein [Bacteroidales bacterium]|nr:glutaredoxin domain-containing protein [Bacteroidales bacterium]
MNQVKSLAELKALVADKERAYLLLYKSGIDKSECALRNVELGLKGIAGIEVYVADVTSTSDIHPTYGVTSVPTLIEFDKGAAKNVIKGCNDSNYYKALFDDALYVVDTKNEETPQKSVTVYSTPTCSWCNTLKAYLRKHRIRFTDIDVSRNQSAADEMVRRSGQRGVPQTDIGGEMIVGFNQARINELLNIRS